MLLEPFATETAVRLLDVEELRRLEQAHETLLRVSTARRVNRRRVSEQNIAWHWIIYEAARMPILAELIRRLWDSFPWRTLWVIPDTAAVSTDDHERIMAAIRARDAGDAAEAMRAHNARGRDYLVAEAESPPVRTGAPRRRDRDT